MIDTVRVTDPAGVTREATVRVGAAIAITPNGRAVSASGSVDFRATGGSGSYQWSATAGTITSSGSYTAPIAPPSRRSPRVTHSVIAHPSTCLSAAQSRLSPATRIRIRAVPFTSKRSAAPARASSGLSRPEAERSISALAITSPARRATRRTRSKSPTAKAIKRRRRSRLARASRSIPYRRTSPRTLRCISRRPAVAAPASPSRSVGAVGWQHQPGGHLHLGHQRRHRHREGDRLRRQRRAGASHRGRGCAEDVHHHEQWRHDGQQWRADDGGSRRRRR